MINIILFFLICFGITNIIVREDIFKWFRKYMDKFKIGILFHCETCLSFWIGLGMYWLLPEITEYIALNIFFSGVLSSAFNKILIITLYKF